MKTFLQNFDFYSSEVYFTVNSGNKRIKTIFGGIITIISFIAIAALSVLFLIQFFKGSSSSVLSKDESTEDLNLPLHQYPFMLRLSTEKVKVYEQTERLYTITLKLKVGGGNNTSQWTDDIQMEQCDINKHFGNFSHLFKDISDIDTFFCPIMRMDNQSVIGIYGGEHLFQYYHFYITMCINSTEESNCYDEATITKYLKATYLDVRTLDYNLDSNDKGEDPYTLYVRSDRHSISNTVYKRVWMYMESIDYYKDIGLVFDSEKLYSFFKVNSFRYDMDMRDMFNGVTIPGTFANLSVLNYSNKKTYYHKYMKAQEFFANMGGITKIISVAGLILNYGFSEAAYKTKIMSYIFEGIKGKKLKKNSYMTTNTINGTSSGNATTTPLSSFQNTKSFKENLEINKTPKEIKTIAVQNINNKRNSNIILSEKSYVQPRERKRLKISKIETIFSKIFCSSKVSQFYSENYSTINNELDINSYITLKRRANDIYLFLKLNNKSFRVSTEKQINQNFIANNNVFESGRSGLTNLTYESSSLKISNKAQSPTKYGGLVNDKIRIEKKYK